MEKQFEKIASKPTSSVNVKPGLSVSSSPSICNNEARHNFKSFNNPCDDKRSQYPTKKSSKFNHSLTQHKNEALLHKRKDTDVELSGSIQATNNKHSFRCSHPDDVDVICEREHNKQNHPGNELLANLISLHREIFIRAETNKKDDSCEKDDGTKSGNLKSNTILNEEEYFGSKNDVAKSLVDIIRGRCDPYFVKIRDFDDAEESSSSTPKGRFLRYYKPDNIWYDIGDGEAEEMIKVSLKDASPVDNDNTDNIMRFKPLSSKPFHTIKTSVVSPDENANAVEFASAAQDAFLNNSPLSEASVHNTQQETKEIPEDNNDNSKTADIFNIYEDDVIILTDHFDCESIAINLTKGTREFWDLIRNNQPKYSAMRDSEKPKLALSLVRSVMMNDSSYRKQTSHSRKGRFLARGYSSSGWQEVGYVRAAEWTVYILWKLQCRLPAFVCREACVNTEIAPNHHTKKEPDSEVSKKSNNGPSKQNEAMSVSRAKTGTPETNNIIQVSEVDVLFGRGGMTNHNPGNIRYRDLVKIHRPDYIKAPKVKKPAVARLIVNAIRKNNPPGRFLKYNPKAKCWYDVGDQKAAEKTSQALREKSQEERYRKLQVRRSMCQQKELNNKINGLKGGNNRHVGANKAIIEVAKDQCKNIATRNTQILEPSHTHHRSEMGNDDKMLFNSLVKRKNTNMENAEEMPLKLRKITDVPEKEFDINNYNFPTDLKTNRLNRSGKVDVSKTSELSRTQESSNMFIEQCSTLSSKKSDAPSQRIFPPNFESTDPKQRQLRLLLQADAGSSSPSSTSSVLLQPSVPVYQGITNQSCQLNLTSDSEKCSLPCYSDCPKIGDKTKNNTVKDCNVSELENIRSMPQLNPSSSNDHTSKNHQNMMPDNRALEELIFAQNVEALKLQLAINSSVSPSSPASLENPVMFPPYLAGAQMSALQSSLKNCINKNSSFTSQIKPDKQVSKSAAIKPAIDPVIPPNDRCPSIPSSTVIEGVPGKSSDDDMITVRENDVLCGRGGRTNHHKGNIRFRYMVNLFRVSYAQATKIQKPEVARLLVRMIRNGDPPGRFLNKNVSTGLWYDIGHRKAAEKASQALRLKVHDVSSCDTTSDLSSVSEESDKDKMDST